MPIKKSKEESVLESAEKVLKKTAKKIAENIEENAERIKEEVIDVIKDDIEETSEKIFGEEKETKKRTSKKSSEKKENSEDKKAKIAALKEKAKELEKTFTETKLESIDLKQKIQAGEEKVDTLVPIEDYLKSSIHLGTRVITPDMRPYVYKRRADGLAVFNTTLLDKKIREAADFLCRYAPEDIILVCKREAGWKAAELFSAITGIRSFTKKYPAGILTNPILEDFMETDLVVICDPWLDKNALNDAKRIKVPVLAMCDTNNYTPGVTQILPGNNKSAKSLGMIFYLLTKIYTEKRKIKIQLPPISEFIENWENLQPPK